ncbi:MAG: PAS domain-containing sensor histidine kinase [Ignavibacteriaceae bacterium]|nr:PAS domain-containing sensor histidine kinase [Ignavibacteriaceae bacterium]
MKQAEFPKELLKSLELHPTAIFVIDAKGIIHFANKTGIAVFDPDNENVSNRNFNEIILEKSKADFKNFLKKVFNSTEEKQMRTTLLGFDGGSHSPLLIAKHSNFPDLNEKVCVLSVVDITGIELKNEMSKRSELRFENMANTAPVMIWIADVDGLFSFINKVWLDYTGKTVGEQLGMNWLKSVHEEDLENLLAVYKSAFKSKERFSAKFRFERMNGEYQWMLINGSPRVNNQGIFSGFIGSCININEQIKNEEKIKEINFQLSESNTTKDKFFSIISHDLRGPLGGLMQLLEILDSDYDSLEEQERIKLISDSAVSAKGTYNLMENLLDWSRVQRGKIEYEPERLDLLRLTNDTVSLYDQNIKSKNIGLKNNIQRKISVFADKKMSETVLRNLISNAIKFTYPSGTILIENEKKDDYVVVKIKDKGVGINKEDIANLFRLDVSHSTKGTENESGTGLGLILCKELVERQGGKIWVESKINEGSTFYFTIPLAL